MSFDGFPERTLLEEASGKFPIAKIARLAKREGQSTRPIYRLHRWFARRLGSQFRSILAALTLPAEASENDFWGRYLGRVPLKGAQVLDPFMGGGTSLVESARCGADVTGRDIDPVATSIARAELSAGSPRRWLGENPKEEGKKETSDVRDTIAPLHKTEVDGEPVRILHHFWTQLVSCEKCSHEVELHPHYRLAYDREKDVQWAFCKKCHDIQALSRDRVQLRCSGCRTYTWIDEGTHHWNTVTCPHCKHEQRLVPEDGFRKEPPKWRLFAQEYLAGPGKRPERKFKQVEEEDRRLLEEASSRLEEIEARASFVPERRVPPEGRLDRRPLIHGVSRYKDLFNDRQLLHLSLLGRRIASLEDPAKRRLFGLAFSEHLTTNCMYTGYAFGYRRTSPLFSFHGYRHIVRPVEINPWLDGIGRGTFPNALRKVRRASDFASAPYDYAPGGEKKKSAQSLKCVLEEDALGQVSFGQDVSGEDPSVANLSASSSTDMGDLSGESFDLVLTDPPYFDNVGYSELSDFYLAWHQTLGIATGPYADPSQAAPLKENMAVTEREDEAAIRSYESDLGDVFEEARRVMKPGALCVFTYHHNNSRAWLALARALKRSGLAPTGLAPMRGEGQGGLHSYDGTIRWDAVFSLRKPEIGGKKEGSAKMVLAEADRKACIRASKETGARFSEEDVGYREPDAVNFHRACLVKRALSRKQRQQRGGDKNGTGELLSLSDALSSEMPNPEALATSSA